MPLTKSMRLDYMNGWAYSGIGGPVACTDVAGGMAPLTLEMHNYY